MRNCRDAIEVPQPGRSSEFYMEDKVNLARYHAYIVADLSQSVVAFH